MANLNPKTAHLEPTHFQGVSGHRVTSPARVRLPLELATTWEGLTLEERSALVQPALESLTRSRRGR